VEDNDVSKAEEVECRTIGEGLGKDENDEEGDE